MDEQIQLKSIKTSARNSAVAQFVSIEFSKDGKVRWILRGIACRGERDGGVQRILLAYDDPQQN
jgi:hypothetical protein